MAALPSRDLAPYRREAPPTADAAADAVERRMLASLLGPAGAPASSSASGSGSGSGSGGKGESLTVTLLSRIQTLEARVTELTARLRDADAAHAVEVAAEREATVAATRRVAAMTRFLADYGLVWVGDEENDTTDSGGTGATSTSLRGRAEPDVSASTSAPRAATTGVAAVAPPPASGRPPPAVLDDGDISILLLRLRQLNERVGAGRAAIVKRDGVHKFEIPTGVPFRVYRDGFFFNRGPFRAYADAASKQLVQDIMDGYFPSEWRVAYPQGVVLEIVDDSRRPFPAVPPAAAGGSGGVSSTAGAGTGAAGAIASLASLGATDLDLGTMTAKEFVSKLPARVIRGGQVVSIRDDIAAVLGSDAKGASAAATAAAPSEQQMLVADTSLYLPAEATATAGSGPADGPATVRVELATIQVKSGDGTQTLIVRLPTTASVGDLYAVVDKHRSHTARYELRTVHPRRALDDRAMTLVEARLAPAAVVHMRVYEAEGVVGEAREGGR